MCRGGGRRGRAPRAAGQRSRLCPLLPCAGSPCPAAEPRREPASLRGRAAPSCGSHPLRLQNKSSGACAGALLGRRLAPRTTCPFPTLKVFVLGVFVVLPAFVLRPPPCSAENGKVLRTRGLFWCRCCACPCRGALSQPRARLLRVLPGRTRASSGRRELRQRGAGTSLAARGRGQSGQLGLASQLPRAPGGRSREAGEGARAAPQRALSLPSPPQKLGCRSGRRLGQRRHVSPGARGTRFVSGAATPLPVFIHLLALLYGRHRKAG